MNTVFIGNKEVTPSKIVCVGMNYVEHIKELGNEIPENMTVFMKPNSAIAKELQSFHKEQLHYEGELCFVYDDDRLSAVGFGLDVTKRELQNKLKSKGHPWERAKAFDGSALFSKFVEISDVSQNLTVELDINGENIQSGSINQMMYKPNDILAELLTFITLNNGDIIMTGTPKGVGIIDKGSLFAGKIKDNGKDIVKVQWLAK
ncbi:MAG: fumarylacetoacetate hydrolase family protein [Candidatus Cloacimonetes bacterium]|nr:fumarylacetoacetate hydrolase family protein [Candidatus Cloacimonadota bacterium]